MQCVILDQKNFFSFSIKEIDGTTGKFWINSIDNDTYQYFLIYQCLFPEFEDGSVVT